ncbi:hypothetical protein NDU88_005308 [Pleurodeles waltl]|uniref:Uncharacterized protein n=1 Tax=Pleurodeles waltl TaxID=8319 RepID=A0AAV7RNG3_PLEWA|nr:hypothetical protein NDU88_005308 [Pleurodeles waltl]
MKPGLDMPQDYSNILMKTAKKCWTKYTHTTQRKYPYAPRPPLWVLPGCMDKRYELTPSAWENAGIVEWGDVFEDHMLIPFDSLVRDYNISPGTSLNFAALTRYAVQYWDTIHDEPQTSALLQTLLIYGGERKTIMNIYNALNIDNTQSFRVLRAYWETTLQTALTDKQWE